MTPKISTAVVEPYNSVLQCFPLILYLNILMLQPFPTHQFCCTGFTQSPFWWSARSCPSICTIIWRMEVYIMFYMRTCQKVFSCENPAILIALGTAQGLAYLHHDCSPPIVHRDIKPKNILLDSDMQPHIAGFGIATLMDHSIASAQASSLMGTTGLGTAQGLAYLHNDCSPPIVHQHIKPKNILLYSDMQPHIAYFSIATLMDHSFAFSQAISLMGTIGYMSPETAVSSRNSRESDVYSYGVVIVELITRKKASDPSFPEDTEIVSWVRLASNDGIDLSKVINPALSHEFFDSCYGRSKELAVLALSCTSKEQNI